MSEQLMELFKQVAWIGILNGMYSLFTKQKNIINSIKNGSRWFIYHFSRTYS